MGSKKFFQTMHGLDSKFIDETTKKALKSVRAKRAVLVVCLCVVVMVVILIIQHYNYVTDNESQKKLTAPEAISSNESGASDQWLQMPSADPIETVQSAIEGQAGKEYTVAVQVDEIKIDEEETEHVRVRYTGSELAEARGWTDEYLEEHFVVIWAKYYVEYDHTKTFLDDGYTEQYFYLAQNIKTGEWMIIDNDSPRTNTTP